MSTGEKLEGSVRKFYLEFSKETFILILPFQVVAVTDYAEGELFQILEDDGQLPEEQVKS